MLSSIEVPENEPIDLEKQEEEQEEEQEHESENTEDIVEALVIENEVVAVPVISESDRDNLINEMINKEAVELNNTMRCISISLVMISFCIILYVIISK